MWLKLLMCWVPDEWINVSLMEATTKVICLMAVSLRGRGGKEVAIKKKILFLRLLLKKSAN